MGRELRLQDRETEQKELTYAPFVVAIGLGTTTVLVTLSAPWALLGLAVIVLGVVMWTRESIRYGPDLIPVHPEYHHEGDRWHHPSNYWWGAVVYSVMLAAGFFASLRVAQAHNILDPDAGELALRHWMGHAATAVAAVAIIGSAWVARESREGRRVGPALAGLAVAPLVMLILVVSQAVLIVTDPAVADTAPRLAALLWLHIFQAVWLGGAVIYLALVALRAFIGHIPHERWNASSAAILFSVIAMAQFVLLWAFVYLRLLQLDADLIT